MTETQTTYTLDDCGCYVDGSHGIYAVDTIIAFAESHGFKYDLNDKFDNDRAYCTGCNVTHALPSECEFSNEIEDEATDYMNDTFPVEGAYWGRSEQGDWGLWVGND
jgi:hypothetical protein